MLTPDEDIHWMQLALEQASKGVGTTSPNPPVGAVIVKGGKLIGKGWHQKAGGPHAEREAIADVLKQHQPEALNGATIYVTLEPCSSHGRTATMHRWNHSCRNHTSCLWIPRPQSQACWGSKNNHAVCRVRSAQRCLPERM